LSFVLAPPVTWLERWLGRVAAVLVVVSLVFVVLGLAGWGLARQLDGLAEDLPSYRANIRAKIADVRGAGTNDRRMARAIGTSTACPQYSTAITRTLPANVIHGFNELGASSNEISMTTVVVRASRTGHNRPAGHG